MLSLFTRYPVLSIRGPLYPLALLLIASLLPGGASAQSFQPPTALNTNAATDSGNDSISHLATDGNGNWVVAWSSDDPLGGTIGTDTDILVSRSTNNGVTWTAPAALNTNAATDAGRDEWVQLSTDGAGTWLAVWTSADTLGNTIGTDDDVLFARSLDAGATWTAPSPLNGQAGSDADTDRAAWVATDGAGNWVAVWVSRDTLGGTIGGDQDIVFARSTDSGATWSAPAALNSNAAVDHAFADDEEPSVDTDGAGNWVAIWDGPQEIAVSRSTDAGVSWSPLAQIPHPFATTHSNWWPSLATDGAGTWVAVWQTEAWDLDSGLDWEVLFSRSTDAGLTWASPAPLNIDYATETRGDAFAQITTDGSGEWIATWTRGFDFFCCAPYEGTDALLSRSLDAGVSWTTPVSLNTNEPVVGRSNIFSSVAGNGAGRWVAVWSSADDLGGTVGGDHDLFVLSWVWPKAVSALPSLGGAALALVLFASGAHFTRRGGAGHSTTTRSGG